MPSGFEIYGEAGNLQFTAETPNMVFAEKGTHSTTTNTSPAPIGSRSRLDVPAGTSKLIAWRPAAGYMMVYQHTLASGTRSYYIMSSEVSTTIDWWTFDVPSAPPSNYGLTLFDAAGQVTYHSFAFPMKIMGVVSNDPGDPANPGTNPPPNQTTLTSPAGRVWAMIQGNLSGWRGEYAGRFPPVSEVRYRSESFWSAISAGANSIAVSERLMDVSTPYDTPIGPPPVKYGPRNFIAVDVTGI